MGKKKLLRLSNSVFPVWRFWFKIVSKSGPTAIKLTLACKMECPFKMVYFFPADWMTLDSAAGPRDSSGPHSEKKLINDAELKRLEDKLFTSKLRIRGQSPFRGNRHLGHSENGLLLRAAWRWRGAQWTNLQHRSGGCWSTLDCFYTRSLTLFL